MSVMLDRAREILARIETRGETIREAAAALGYNSHTARRYLQEATRAGEKPAGRQGLPLSKLLTVEVAPAAPLRVTGDPVIVGDVHVPATDEEMVHRVWEAAAARVKRRDLIIAGDLFNLDFMSSHPPNGTESRWRQECEAAQHIIEYWLTAYERIYMIAGNHERRLTRKTVQLNIADLMRMVTHDPRVIVSEWGHLHLTTSAGVTWRVTHGRNYSVNALKVGDMLAQKFRTNIIVAHQHHAGIGLSRYGQEAIIDLPALVRLDKLGYAVLDDSTSANMERGYLVFEQGYPRLYIDHPALAGWASALRTDGGAR